MKPKFFLYTLLLGVAVAGTPLYATAKNKVTQRASARKATATRGTSSAAPARDCTTTSGHVYTLLQADSSSASWAGGSSNQSVVVAATYPAGTTATVTTGSGKCGTVEGGTTNDTHYPTTSTYNLRSVLEGSDQTPQAIFPTYFEDTTPSLGDNYSTVQVLNTTPCAATVAGSTLYFWKVCLAP